MCLDVSVCRARESISRRANGTCEASARPSRPWGVGVPGCECLQGEGGHFQAGQRHLRGVGEAQQAVSAGHHGHAAPQRQHGRGRLIVWCGATGLGWVDVRGPGRPGASTAFGHLLQAWEGRVGVSG